MHPIVNSLTQTQRVQAHAAELLREIDDALTAAAIVVAEADNSPAWSVAKLLQYSLEDARRRALKLLGEVKR